MHGFGPSLERRIKMNTQLIPPGLNQDLSLAVHVLQKGGLVAIPTETVYGLAANALDPEAVRKIFLAKGRPADNPLIIHIASMEQLPPLVTSVSPMAQKLMTAFWPGPLTLVFSASSMVPPIVSAGLPTVAIRFPDHPIAQELILSSGLVLAAPSANTSGKPSPTTAQRVLEDLDGKIEVIVDGGRVKVGLESTVVDVTGEIPVILRPGKITEDMIKDVTGHVRTDPALGNSPDNHLIPKSPGMKYTHYSPNAQVYIVEGHEKDVIQRIHDLTLENQKNNKKVGIMATDETITSYTKGDMILSLGSQSALETIAYSLFESLRAFDDAKMDIVYTEGFSTKGIGNAIMNRLVKAAGYKIIQATPTGGFSH